MPKNSKARLQANKRWNEKAYDQLLIRVKKGQKDIIQEIASSKGLSINGYVQLAINRQLSEDRADAKQNSD